MDEQVGGWACISSVSPPGPCSMQVGHFLNSRVLPPLKKKIIYLWLHWVFVAAQAFSSWGKWGLHFVAVHGLLITVSSRACQLQ